MRSGDRCKAHYQGDRCRKEKGHDSHLTLGNPDIIHESDNWRWVYHSDRVATGLNRESKKEFVKTLDKLITLSKEKR